MNTNINKDNRNLTFKGSKLTNSGTCLIEGDAMPAFLLTGQDMADLSSEAFKGKILIILTVPSLDTPVCATETKKFNDAAAKMSDQVTILTVSMDLPFAQKRWCGAEGVTRVITASDYKYREFAKSFGASIDEWGLLSRAVFIIDRSGKIAYVEYVAEVSAEPDYDTALKKASELLEAK